MKNRFAAINELIQAWWQPLSMRERYLVFACSFMLAIGLIYWGIYQPLVQSREQAQLRLNNEKQLLSWVTNSANSISQLKKQGARANIETNQPLNQIISSSATRYNVELIRMQPRDEMLQVWLQPIPFEQLINWLTELRDHYGINVVFLDINRSATSGVVDVNRLQFQRMP